MRPPAGPAAHPLTARGLIRDRQGRWLLVRRVGDECWQLPGSGIEQDEPPRRACRREIREELGLDLPPGVLLAVGWNPPRRDGRRVRVSFIFDMGSHDADDLAGCIRLQLEELTAWRWAQPCDALALLHPDIAARLADHHPDTPPATRTAVYIEHQPAAALAPPMAP